MNPFTEIEVTPLFSKDGMKSQGKSVRILDPDEQSNWKELGVVSSNYLLVHNSKVKSAVDEIAGQSLFESWNERKLFFDGRRFVYAVTTEDLTAEVTPGDLIRFGLIGYNSYDGSRALSIGMYAEHLVCSNGMTSETYFSRFTFRHHQGNINWSEQVESALTTILSGSREKLISFASNLNKLKRKRIDTSDLCQIRENHLSNFSVTHWGKIIDRFLTCEEHTAFGLMDACTRVFWHNEKQSYSDYRNNSDATDSLIRYSERLLN